MQNHNARLPQPFVPGTDLIEQKFNAVTLRLPVDWVLGYVQIVETDAQVMLVVTGMSDAGVQLAANTIVLRPWQLKGNLTFIRADGQVNTLDTRVLTQWGGAQALTFLLTNTVVAVTPTITVTPVFSSVTSEPAQLIVEVPRRAEWVIPLTLGTFILVIVMVGIGIGLSRRRRK
jgi:hypothetical protein